ncbi:crotonobetainyl-CoA:carnitine CoA-transferase CaiB-like acyl-CoA transferase [Sphingomonas zeicaulis]|uniref:CoA transferase n=1 Tax=Sphingomonas zeicaulis TaxID=1632740 RepID=UPI003D23163E
MIWGFRTAMGWRDERGTNLLDSAAHFNHSHETGDGKYVALGAIEPQFYAAFRRAAGIAHELAFDAQKDPVAWGPLKARLAALFRTRTRDEWCALMDSEDACLAPVLSMAEAPDHPHNRARGAFVEREGVIQPAPAPRFSSI